MKEVTNGASWMTSIASLTVTSWTILLPDSRTLRIFCAFRSAEGGLPLLVLAFHRVSLRLRSETLSLGYATVGVGVRGGKCMNGISTRIEIINRIIYDSMSAACSKLYQEIQSFILTRRKVVARIQQSYSCAITLGPTRDSLSEKFFFTGLGLAIISTILLY